MQGTDSVFTVNNVSGTQNFVGLSDGIHDITLEICDDKGNSRVDETRTIELSNQPPVIVVSTDPVLVSMGRVNIADNKTG